jgi:RNA polymerase sigma-70 factor (ECF subfamily)
VPDRDESDAKLLAAISSGNQKALAELIALYGRGLRIFAARFLDSASDAEEVVQEVFVTVWKRAGWFDPDRGKASTWLYKITANRCIDARRRRAFRNLVGLEGVQDSLVADEPGADARTEARQELSIVRDGLALLPDRQRMALLLTVVADLDTVEVAESMGTSRGSVEQLLVRARRSLRDYVQSKTNGYSADERKLQ